jgi:uroporphyrinogen decarboxylase
LSSLQPWEKYQTDGCILFSDILTPLPGMGVQFNIDDSGPKLGDWKSKACLSKLKTLDPHTATPFVGEILRNLRREVRNETTVLGFVGAPFTLASYMVEGGSSTEFASTKRMMYNDPSTLHSLLHHLETNIASYAIYQIENGAQVIQLFDSWAGTLAPKDYDEFALHYQRGVINRIKEAHPSVPIIIYAAKSGAIIEKLGKIGADCVSLDWTTSLSTARARLSDNGVVLQGNLDPLILLAPKEIITARTEEILREGGGRNHIMNLGHGVYTQTPEENVKHFVDTVKRFQKTT